MPSALALLFVLISRRMQWFGTMSDTSPVVATAVTEQTDSLVRGPVARAVDRLTTFNSEYTYQGWYWILLPSNAKGELSVATKCNEAAVGCGGPDWFCRKHVHQVIK